MNKDTIFLLKVIFPLILLLHGCGRDTTSNNPISHNTGSAVFSVEWQDDSAAQSAASDASHSGLILAKAVDCTAAGIDTVQSTVFDSSPNPKVVTSVSGGPWKCSDHSGKIDNIPVGAGYSIALGFMDKDGKLLYVGVTTDVSIEADKITDVGVIKVYLYAPSEVTAVAGDGQVTINWKNDIQADGYYIYWSKSSGVSKTSYSGKLSTTTNSYTHSNLTNGTTYYYIVTAKNIMTDSESSESSEVSATPKK